MTSKYLVQAIALIIFVSPAFAEYKTNIRKGNELYRSGDYRQALIYYRQAQEEKPSEKLAAVISKLERKVTADTPRRTVAAPTYSEQRSEGGSIITPRNGVIFVGLATGVTGIVLGLSNKGKAEDFYTQYMAAETEEDAERLYVNHEAKVESSDKWYLIGGCGIGLAAGAYLVDKFWLSKRGSVALAPEFNENGTRLVASIRF